MKNWETLVESVIDSIHLDQSNNELRIDITTAWENKERKQIIASGVDDFVINEMRFSNIIDRIHIFDQHNVENCKSEIAKRLFFLLRGEEPSLADLEWKVLQDKLKSIQNAKLMFLEIEPVYGATILVLAKHIQLN